MSKVVVVAFADWAIAVIAVLNKTNTPFEWKPVGEINIFGTDPQIIGGLTVLKHVAAQAGLDKDGNEEELKKWTDFITVEFKKDPSSVAAALETVNNHLKMRTFVAGYSVTTADILLLDALRASPIWNRAYKGKDIAKYPYLHRWFEYISQIDYIEKAVKAVEEQRVLQKQQQQQSQKKDQGSFDVKLKGAVQGGVVTRFPPEPSGYLHIGHAKAALLNQYFAEQYEGRLIVRFDDTNPSKEKEEFEQSILEDLELLKIKGDVVSHTSDYFDEILEYAVQLIKEGWAYCDDTIQEKMRHERMHGIASVNRENSVEDNLKHFEEMQKGTPEGLRWCLRAKMSVDSKNKALRDPVMFRCNLEPHNRTGTKYKVYPTYDFACPIVDSIEGVTHALRTSEYHDRNDQYIWFLDKLKLRKPEIWDYSRMNFVKTLLSKRKLAWFVDNGVVAGWDDARFPTIRGILRRGMTVEALKQYILMQGASKNILLLEWDKLWALNRSILDPIVPRFTAINCEKWVKVKLDGPSEPFTKDIPKHKKNPSVGTKVVHYTNILYIEGADAAEIQPDEEVTLMDYGNVIIKNIHREGDKITSMDAILNLEGDFKKTKKKLTWLADIPNLVDATLIDYDFLIMKKKIEEEEDFQSFLNPITEYRTKVKADPTLATLSKGDTVQLERRGYFIVDSTSPLTLLEIPDGKNKTTFNGTPVPANLPAAK